jgi:hypothetical protein
MEDNKICCKPQFKCSICGKIYDKPIDRAKCEIDCTKKQEEDAKRLLEEKKKAEQKARHAEVTKAIDDAYKLLDKYMKDYGTYHYNGNNLSILDDVLPSKFLHYFLF